MAVPAGLWEVGGVCVSSNVLWGIGSIKVLQLIAFKSPHLTKESVLDLTDFLYCWASGLFISRYLLHNITLILADTTAPFI